MIQAGAKQCNADALSRKPPCCENKGKKCFWKKFSDLEFEPPVFMDTTMQCDAAVQCDSDPSLSEVENFIKKADVLENTFLDETIVNPIRVSSVFPFWTVDDIRQAQDKDPDIGPVIKLLRQEDKKPPWVSVSHRKWYHENGKVQWYQLALPLSISRSSNQPIT